VRSISKKNITLKLYKDDIDITEDGKINTEKKIKELFGSYDNMIMTSMILQVGHNFIDTSDNDKKNILTNVLGLNLYDDIYTFNKKRYNTLCTNILKNIEKQLTNKDYIQLIEDIKDEKEYYSESLCSLDDEYMALIKEEELLQKEHSNINIIALRNQKKILKEDINNIIIDIDKKLLELDISEFELLVILQKTEDENIIITKKILELTKKILKVKEHNISIIENNIKIRVKNKKELESKLLEEESNEINLIEEIIDLELEYNKDDILLLKTSIKEKQEELEEKKRNINLLENLESKNRYLLDHKFNEECEECKINKLIHIDIGYKNEIKKIKKNISKKQNIEQEIEELEIKYNNTKKLNNKLNDQQLLLKNIEIIKNKINLNNKELEDYEQELISNNNNKITLNEIKELEELEKKNKLKIDLINNVILLLNKQKIINESYNNIVNEITRYNNCIDDNIRYNEIQEDKKYIKQNEDSDYEFYDEMEDEEEKEDEKSTDIFFKSSD
jgi:hypothetical protein